MGFPKTERQEIIKKYADKAQKKANRNPFGFETVKTRVYYANREDANRSLDNLVPYDRDDSTYIAELDKDAPCILTGQSFVGPKAAYLNALDEEREEVMGREPTTLKNWVKLDN